MNHPHELLAEYVDGTLPEGERAVVDAHLRDCPECLADVGAAGTARQALASLTDGPVPAGIGDAALAEAAGGAPIHRSAPRWYRYSGVAAAAVIVALLAVALPRLGSNDGAGTSQEAAPAADAAAPAAPAQEELRIEEQDLNYSEDALRGLIEQEQSFAEDQRAEITTDALEGSREALACLRTAYPPVQGRAVQLIRARFSGTEAFIGVFDARGQDVSPSQSAVAASVRGCSLLSVATRS